MNEIFVIEPMNKPLTLADEINLEHEAFISSLETAVHHAIRCGRLLIEQKTKCFHGEWGAWVEANCRFSYRAARSYMRLADAYSSNWHDYANFVNEFPTICSVLKYLAAENKPEQPEEKPAPLLEETTDKYLLYAIIKSGITDKDRIWLLSRRCIYYFEILNLPYEGVKAWAEKGCPTIEETITAILDKVMERENPRT